MEMRPQIHQFITSLERLHVPVNRVPDIEEVLRFYYKSGGNAADIVNTIPELGPVNKDTLPEKIYQFWTLALLGDATTGNVWLENLPTITPGKSITCDHLVMVIDAGTIAANILEANKIIVLTQEAYGIQISPGSVSPNLPFVTCNYFLYLIDPDLMEYSQPAHCAPGCFC